MRIMTIGNARNYATMVREKDEIRETRILKKRSITGMAVPTMKRNRTTSGSQLLLKDRLENLSLNADANTPGRLPVKGTNKVQLLLQGLNSKDKNFLSTVLFTRKEDVIRNTIAKLPVQAITPLLKELIIMLQGKTYA